MSPRKAARKAGKATTAFTDVERAVMKEHARDVKAARTGKVDGEGALLAKIAKMKEPDRTMAKRFHAIVMASAPSLSPRTWYGMPAYEKDGKVVCHFQDAQKFKTRYSSFGFSDQAKLDDGALWPVAYALKALTAAEEARIGALVKKAVG